MHNCCGAIIEVAVAEEAEEAAMSHRVMGQLSLADQLVRRRAGQKRSAAAAGRGDEVGSDRTCSGFGLQLERRPRC